MQLIERNAIRKTNKKIYLKKSVLLGTNNQTKFMCFPFKCLARKEPPPPFLFYEI